MPLSFILAAIAFGTTLEVRESDYDRDRSGRLDDYLVGCCSGFEIVFSGDWWEDKLDAVSKCWREVPGFVDWSADFVCLSWPYENF